mgnify:CR=1 FL=1
MLEPHMLTHIEHLATFLTSGSHSVTALGKHLSENTLKSFNLVGCYFLKKDNKGQVKYIDGFKSRDQITERPGGLDVKLKLPSTDCLRTGEVTWLNGKAEWEDTYPLTTSFHIDERIKTMIHVPMQFEGNSQACLGLFAGEDVKRSPELNNYLKTVAGIMGLYANSLHEFQNDSDVKSRKLLSRRQNKILDLIREKLTNREIGEELGYSESTIRQETMRIYNILSVDNRREAAAFKFIED